MPLSRSSRLCMLVLCLTAFLCHSSPSAAQPAAPSKFTGVPTITVAPGVADLSAATNALVQNDLKSYNEGFITGSYRIAMTGEVPTPFTFTMGATQVSNVQYSATGGSCERRSEDEIRCTGEMSALSISFDYRSRVVLDGMFIRFDIGLYVRGFLADITVVQAYKTPPFTFISANLKQTEHLPGSSVDQPNKQRWQESNSDGVTPSTTFSVGWINTGVLYSDYVSKRGTNEAAYAHQFWYIADASRKEYESKGTNGYANRFVKYLFDYMETTTKYDGLTYDCFFWQASVGCFNDASIVHGALELLPGFTGYCSVWSANNENGFSYSAWESRWTIDHEQFLASAFDPGFDNLGRSGDLPSWYIPTAKSVFRTSARGLRNAAQEYCNGESGSNSLGAAQVQQSPLPTRDELYLTSFNANLPLQVTETSNKFFLRPGESAQLRVVRTQNGANITTDRGTKYYVSERYAGVITLTPDGKLTVLRNPSPSQYVPPIIYVTVVNGNSYGIGQLAITDVDTDGDSIVDSYETYVGLDPKVANDRSSDKDADSLPDIYEALLFTDPLKADSDGDGLSDQQELKRRTLPNVADTDVDSLSDGEEVLTHETLPLNPDSDGDSCADGLEVQNGSDPLDPASIPTTVCSPTQIYLPLITQR